MDGSPLKCDVCGRFISYEDVIKKLAIHYMVTPDSDWSSEEWETHHVRCVKVDKR